MDLVRYYILVWRRWWNDAIDNGNAALSIPKALNHHRDSVVAWLGDDPMYAIVGRGDGGDSSEIISMLAESDDVHYITESGIRPPYEIGRELY